MIDSSQWICNLLEAVFLKISLNDKDYCWEIETSNQTKNLNDLYTSKEKATAEVSLKLSS